MVTRFIKILGVWAALSFDDEGAGNGDGAMALALAEFIKVAW